MRTEIRVAGFGGQGIVLAGVILGEGAIAEEKNAVQTQSYGPESRGGAARSEVIIADEAIDYPSVLAADCLVVLSQPGFDKYGRDVRPGAAVLLDEDLVQGGECPEAGSLHRLPFTRTADELGNRIVANIVMLGSLCAVTGVVGRESLLAAVEDSVPARFRELNAEAFNRGYDLGAGRSAP